MMDSNEKESEEQKQTARIIKLEKEIEYLKEDIDRINKYVYPKATLERYLKEKNGNIFVRMFLYILYFISKFSMFFIEKFGFIMGNFVRKLLFFVFLLWLSFFGVTKYVQYQINSYTESIKESINTKVTEKIVDPSKKGIQKINETIDKVIIDPVNKLLH